MTHSERKRLKLGKVYELLSYGKLRVTLATPAQLDEQGIGDAMILCVHDGVVRYDTKYSISKYDHIDETRHDALCWVLDHFIYESDTMLSMLQKERASHETTHRLYESVKTMGESKRGNL